MKFDELNIITEKIKALKWDKLTRQEKSECEDLIEDLLIFQWTMGWEDANRELETKYDSDPYDILADLELKIKGEGYKERLAKATTSDEVARIADTEGMRMYNSSVDRMAKKTNSKKTWNTMLDSRVRDTHSYLEGETIKAGEKFFTYDGDSALAPGGFTSASNNCNCRCYITLSK